MLKETIVTKAPPIVIKKVKPGKPERYSIEESPYAPNNERGKSKYGCWAGNNWIYYAYIDGNHEA